MIDPEGKQVGVLPIKTAQENADKLDLDLVEISPDVDPPVCRIMNYGKYQFERTKRKHVAKKHQKHMQVKEVKFRSGTEKGDYNIKLQRAIKFLNQGDKVKVSLRFRGREMMHTDLGAKMLDRVVQDTKECAIVEQAALMEGRQMIMVLSPRKNSKSVA